MKVKKCSVESSVLLFLLLMSESSPGANDLNALITHDAPLCRKEDVKRKNEEHRKMEQALDATLYFKRQCVS